MAAVVVSVLWPVMPVAGATDDGSGELVPVSPCRIADTRLAGGRLTGTDRTFTIDGTDLTAQGGNPTGCGIPTGAIAAVIALSAVDPLDRGWLRAWPADQTPPTATLLNYTTGTPTTNTTTIPLSPTGDITVRNFKGHTHLVIDIVGYHVTDTGSRLVPVPPCRIADTRLAGGRLTGTERTFTIDGTDLTAQGGNPTGCGIPTGAIAAVIALSAVDPLDRGWLRAWPADQTPPTATLLNYTTGTPTTNTTTIPLSPTGDITVRNFKGHTHLVIDIVGYHGPPIPRTEMVSVATDGTQADAHSVSPAISADGRHVAFTSFATNLVAGDTNGAADIFAHDRETGQTTRVSVATDGTQGDLASTEPAITGDGRYVAFTSSATNLVAGDTNGAADIFVHDRDTGQTTRVSVATDGTQGDADSAGPAISADGRHVAFTSFGTNLVAGDTNGAADIFVHDRDTGQTTRVSVATDGTQADAHSAGPAISADGRHVAFTSFATNLVAGDTNGAADIFAHDRDTGQTTRVSVATDGTQGDLASTEPAITGDGRYVAFTSSATNLVAGDTNGAADIFAHDRDTGQTTRVSVATDGTQGDADSAGPAISADGRHVAFTSFGTNLVAGDTNGAADIFVHDRDTGQTTRVSVATDGTQGDAGSSGPAITPGGTHVAFSSAAANLVPGDTNGVFSDVFVRARAC